MNKLWDTAMQRMKEEDRKLFENEIVRKCTVAMLRAAFVQGADGATHETKLLTRPWGFELQDVK